MTTHVRAANTALGAALKTADRTTRMEQIEAAKGALDLALTSHGVDPLTGEGARRILVVARFNVGEASLARNPTSRVALDAVRSALFSTDLLLP